MVCHLRHKALTPTPLPGTTRSQMQRPQMFARLTILIAATFLLAGCAEGPRDIAIGSEECAHCRMIVSEERFAAQLRTEHGRSLAFDAIECLADFLQQGQDARVRAMWVSAFNAPGTWIPAEEAFYLRSPALRSPMGLNLTAYATLADAQQYQRQYQGDVLDWAGVLRLLEEMRVAGTPGGHDH